MEEIKTLTRVINDKDQEIKALKDKIENLTIQSSSANEMTFRGNRMRDMDKNQLTDLCNYLFDLLKPYDQDIRRVVLHDNV